jgi:predicted dehydrogenase
VYICLPPFAHGDPERAVLERGLPMFVEKPLSTDLAVAREIAGIVERQNITTCVGYNWRYLDSTDRAREILTGKRPALGIGYWIGGTPGVAWWRVKTQSGGQVVEQTTHIFDIARYLMGEVKTVYAAASKGLVDDLPNYDVEDASTVSLTFENGAVATILSSCVVDQGYGAEMHILARGVTVRIGSGKLVVEESGKTTILPSQNNPYQRESEIFLAAVESKDPSGIRSPYTDSLKSLAVTLAVNESFETGKAVAL